MAFSTAPASQPYRSAAGPFDDLESAIIVAIDSSQGGYIFVMGEDNASDLMELPDAEYIMVVRLNTSPLLDRALDSRGPVARASAMLVSAPIF
jgi:hypothetical protein